MLAISGLLAMISQEFFSCDWGTSHFRLRLVDSATLEIKHEVSSGEGVGHIFRNCSPAARAETFAAVLAGHLLALYEASGSAAARCVVSGMASSTIGWHELPYAVAPLALDASSLEKRDFQQNVGGRAVDVRLVSGVRTADDVMRGEESELLGLWELCPELSLQPCRLILPGTHSKHVDLEGRGVKNFRTFMTGELFAHLRMIPTLSAILEAEGDAGDFVQGARAARDLGLSGGLFKIRARSVIAGENGGVSAAFLSGLLIGDELAKVPGGMPVYLAGASKLHNLYLRAGECLGVPMRAISPEILRQALVCAHRMLLLD